MKRTETSNAANPELPYWTRYLKPYTEDEKRTSKKTVETQMVVYRSDDNNDKFDRWIKWLEVEIENLKRPKESIRISRICHNCDNSLMLLVGEGVEAFVTTEGAVRGAGAGSPLVATEEPGIYRSANFPVGIPERLTGQKKPKANKLNPILKNMNKIVTVAVLDTGLESDVLTQFLIEPNNNTCIPTAVQGWDFTDDTADFNDDHHNNHGTTVSALLITQSLKTKNGNPVRIIPVKVQNEKGISNLYDVMCGLAYAKSMGAEIINASFGYYAPLDYHRNNNFCVEVFRAFIKDVLTDNGILLIAAAGNSSTKQEIEQLFSATNHVSGELLHEAPENPENLDEVHFFPASFAADENLWNVFSVTTVTPGAASVSPTQNYSRNVVDIGVPADESLNNGFADPLHDDFVYGSSFATPKVAGMIAGNYDLIAGIRSKEGIFKLLISHGLLGNVPPTALVRRAILK